MADGLIKGQSPLEYLTQTVSDRTGVADLTGDGTSRMLDYLSSLTTDSTQQGFGGPLGLSDPYQDYTPYLGESFNPYGDVDERRAQAQGTGERWLNASLRFAPSVIGKTIQSFGNIAAMPFAMAEQDINTMIDNPIVNLGRAMEEYVDDALPIYQRRIYTQGDFLDKIGTSEFWTIDGMDGFEFLTSAFLTSAGVAKGVNFAFRDKMISNLAKMNRVQKTEVADELLKKGIVDAEQLMYNTKFGATTILNTIGEAGIEARELRDMLMDQGVDPDIASKAAANTALQNVGALLLSNAWQTRLFMGGSGLSKAARLKEFQKSYTSKQGLPASEKLTFNQLKKGAEGVKKSLPKEFLKQGSISAVTEGGWEENVQTAIQKVQEHNAFNNPDYLSSNALEGFGDIAQQMVKNFSETEGQTAIFLGALLGVFGAAGSAIRDKNQSDKFDKDLIKLLAAGDILTDANLKSIAKLDADGNFELDKNGNIQLDPLNASLIAFKHLEDKSIFDEAMAAQMRGDEVTEYMLSQIILARDMYRHTKSKDDLEFYKAKQDIMLSGQDTESKMETIDSYKNQIKEFQATYLDRLTQLAAVTKTRKDIKGLDAKANQKVRDALFMQGAYQFIIEELIKQQEAKRIETGTDLDTTNNTEIDNRLKYLNKLLEDSKKGFGKLTDAKGLKTAFDNGMFEQTNLNIARKQRAELKKTYESTSDPKEKEKIKDELDSMDDRIRYEQTIEEEKYGTLFKSVIGPDKKGSTVSDAKPPMFYDIVQDEYLKGIAPTQNLEDLLGRTTERRATGLSSAQFAAYSAGLGYGIKGEIRDQLKAIKDDPKQDLTQKTEALKKAIRALSSLANTQRFTYLGYNTDPEIDAIDGMLNDISKLEQSLANVIAKFRRILNQVESFDPSEIDYAEIIEENIGATILKSGNLEVQNEGRWNDMVNVFGRDEAHNIVHLLYSYTGNQQALVTTLEHTANRLAGIQRQVGLPVLKGQVKELSATMKDKVAQNSNTVDGLKNFSAQNISAFDNQYDSAITQDHIDSIDKKLEAYDDPRAIIEESQVEKDLTLVKGGIEYYTDRQTRPSADKAKAKQFIKEFKRQKKALEKVLTKARDQSKKNEMKLQKLRRDAADEQWQGLGRDYKGEVVDEEIEKWLTDNIEGYADVVLKAEKDEWNPIYAAYIYSLINKQQKISSFKSLLKKKVRKYATTALFEIQRLGNEAYGRKWVSLGQQGYSLIGAYKTNPRANLFSLLKASGFFTSVYPVDTNPNVSSFLVSNDVNDFDIEGIDKKLKKMIENHKKATALAQSMKLVSSKENLLTKINSERAMLELLGDKDFAPAPNQVEAMRAFYSFFFTENSDGVFGNTAALGGVTGAGKTKMFTKALEIAGVKPENIFAFGHTINSTININNQVDSVNKNNLSAAALLPREVLNGERHITEKELNEIVKDLPKNMSVMLLDEGFALTGTSIYALGAITEKYAKDNDINTKLLILGDPSQLTLTALDGVTDVSNSYQQDKIDGTVADENKIKAAMERLTFLPFLSINYRSNNFAISHGQAQFIGKRDLPSELTFFISDSDPNSNQRSGIQAVDTYKDTVQILRNNIGNGRTKILIVPDTTKMAAAVADLGPLLNNTVGNEPEIRVITALDAQGEEANEIYIGVQPDDYINSVTFDDKKALANKEYVRSDTGPRQEVKYTDYNTLMYMLIGRATDFVVTLTPASSEVNKKVDNAAIGNYQQFVVDGQKNKEEYGERINKELEILSSLTGQKVTPIKKKPQPQPQTTTETEEDTGDGNAKVHKEGESVAADDIHEGSEVEEGVEITVTEEYLKDDEETLDDPQVQEEDRTRDDHTADSETLENDNEEESIPEIKESRLNDLENDGPWELKIEHPKSANIRKVADIILEQEGDRNLKGQTVYFAKVDTTGQYPYAIRVYFPYGETNAQGQNITFYELGEIDGRTFESKFGKYMDAQLEALTPGDSTEGKVRLDPNKMHAATVSMSSAVQFTYSEQFTDPNPEKAIRDSVDMILDSLFTTEELNKNEPEIEFLIATKGNTKGSKKHPAFDRKQNFQLGAPYMYVNVGGTGFTVRLSSHKLTKDDEEVKTLSEFVALTKDLEAKAKAAGYDNILLGTKDFRDLIQAIKPALIAYKKKGTTGNRDIDYGLRFYKERFGSKISEEDIKRAGVSRDFFADNFQLIVKLFRMTHSPKRVQHLVTREEFEDKYQKEGWKAVKAVGDKFKLEKEVEGHKQTKTIMQITSEVSDVNSALKRLVLTNQFNGQGEANDIIKAVRYVSKNKYKKSQRYNSSGITPQSILYSEGKVNQVLFEIIRRKYKEIHRLDNSFYNIGNERVNMDNFREYIEYLEEYAQENPANEEVAEALEYIGKYESQLDRKRMSVEDLERLISMDENGESNFGDGTYLRKPLSRSIVSYWNYKDTGLEQGHKYFTSKLQNVAPTQLFVQVDPADRNTQSDNNTPPPQPQDTLLDLDFLLNNDVTRDFGELTDTKFISIEQAQQIAKQLIPGISKDQLEFIGMHLLQHMRSPGKANKLLGQMRSKVISLGIIEGTEKAPKIYEQVLRHELFHLLWNYYIPTKTREQVKNYLYDTYPETKYMNHVEIDEFIADRFQEYNPNEKPKNLLDRIYKKIISWFNLMINNKKSLYSLFEDIQAGKFNASTDYSAENFQLAAQKLNESIDNKFSELQEAGQIEKVCK